MLIGGTSGGIFLEWEGSNTRVSYLLWNFSSFILMYVCLFLYVCVFG